MSEHTKEKLEAMNRISELTRQRDKLVTTLELIKTRFGEKVKINKSYLEEMKRTLADPKHEDIYDQIQTNIQETESLLVDYEWFASKATAAIAGD